VHAHWWFPNGIMAAALAGVSGLPLVTTMHGSDVRLARNTPASHRLLRWVLRRSRCATAVSRWLSDEAHEMAPTLPAPIVAPMPAATDLFFPGGEREQGRLLFVGRLNAQKGIEVLLRAIALMHRPAALDVVGAGELDAVLRALAGSLGIANRVTWHGALPPERLAPLYRRAAALVVPSRDEGLGLVAVEAQLCETPVIAFDSGGLRDIVQNQRTGILVTHQTPGALAVAIDDVLANYDHALDLAREARRAALETFAPASVARRYAALYEQVTGAVAARGLTGAGD
jgi:glycosyltransferase involved in cell wall biosynthesis